jgi:cation diffusion facilitator family transporter
MHLATHSDARHEHVYLDESHHHGERRTTVVAALTFVMMAVEIAAGAAFNSMALLADGFHMASHVAALGLAAFAYQYARRHSRNARFTFGTGKVGALGGFTSAVVLAIIALIMAWESTGRLLAPAPIEFGAAMVVAAIGLAVNLASAMILEGRHEHHEHQGHAHRIDAHAGDHRHGHIHADHNLRAAYLHVLADALTSVLALIALGTGWALGWTWLDPVMGLVGAAVILWWSRGLLRGTTRVLLDADADLRFVEEIRRTVEGDADNVVSDLHVWRVGTGHFAAIVSLVTHHPRPPEHYKALLGRFESLAHVTVEVVPCPGVSCQAA